VTNGDLAPWAPQVFATMCALGVIVSILFVVIVVGIFRDIWENLD
jgi:hypothetical protein